MMNMLRSRGLRLASMIAGAAHADCLKGNAGIPPGANTTDPRRRSTSTRRASISKPLPPTRDPKNPNYPRRPSCPTERFPPIKAEGNFIIGPTHSPAPELTAQDGAPTGKVYSFTMSSNDSTVFNPGMIRDDPDGCLNASVYTGQTAPGDKSNLLVPTAHAGIWTRSVDVYVPPGYVGGKRSSVHCPWRQRLPRWKSSSSPSSTISIHEASRPADRRNQHRRGGQDAQGSERGFEYDAVNGAYAEFVENEVLPLAESHANIKLTKNPEGRATMGISSSGVGGLHDGLVPSRALPPRAGLFADGGEPAMAAQSGPAGRRLGVSQRVGRTAGRQSQRRGRQVAKSDAHFGSPLIPNSPTKPIRIWFETGDHDLFYPVTPVADGMHDWVLADERFAKVLADKGYHYQFLFARNARTCR